MSPVIIFGRPFWMDEDPDLEPCSMCGNPEMQLAFVRFEEMLLGICPACASALNAAHARMSAERIRRREQMSR